MGYSPVELHNCFERTYYFHLQNSQQARTKQKTVSPTSRKWKDSIGIHGVIPEDNTVHNHGYEQLKPNRDIITLYQCLPMLPSPCSLD
jgi:hypothetical protein